MLPQQTLVYTSLYPPCQLWLATLEQSWHRFRSRPLFYHEHQTLCPIRLNERRHLGRNLSPQTREQTVREDHRRHWLLHLLWIPVDELKLYSFKLQWRIQDFPKEGLPERGCANLLFDNFLQKTTSKWMKLDRGPVPSIQSGPWPANGKWGSLSHFVVTFVILNICTFFQAISQTQQVNRFNWEKLHLYLSIAQCHTPHIGLFAPSRFHHSLVAFNVSCYVVLVGDID